MDEVKIDYRIFFRNIKFELYNIFKDYNFKDAIYLVKQFFFLTFSNNEKDVSEVNAPYDVEGVAKMDFIYFPLYCDYYKDNGDYVDLTKLAKYVGKKVLEMCEEKGYNNVIIRDYSNFVNHNQVKNEDMFAPLVKYSLQ